MPEKDKPSNKDYQQGMSETARSQSAGSAGQEGKGSGSQRDTGRATQDKPETSGGE